MSLAGGTIHATADGGGSWASQESSTAWSDPWSMAFASASCGWMVGATQLDSNGNPPGGAVSTILATTDGGATWQRQHAGTADDFLVGVACADGAHAWVVAGADARGGIILATSDGGATWRRQYRGKAGDLNRVAFADARHGWAVGDGVILATRDGGAHWRQQGAVGHDHVQGVACANARDAWAVGADGSGRGVILATRDGGAHWKVQYSRARTYLSGIACADAAHGWVVGFGGGILATSDGGKSWRMQRSGTKIDLYDVAFADARHGLVVGNSFTGDDPLAAKFNGSIIIRTADGGATWTQ